MKLYWLDLETTGLLSTSRILEVSVAEADLATPFDYKHIYNEVLHFKKEWGQFDSFVDNMHTKNGLWDECAKSTKTVLEVENELLQLIPNVEDKESKNAWAGSSVHFDAKYIKLYMPTLSDRFSHRYYDVSAVKLFCRSLGMDKSLFPEPTELHRAQKDVEESVEHAKICRSWLKLTNW